jgi:hypothetical protein
VEPELNAGVFPCAETPFSNGLPGKGDPFFFTSGQLGPVAGILRSGRPGRSFRYSDRSHRLSGRTSPIFLRCGGVELSHSSTEVRRLSSEPKEGVGPHLAHWN